MIDSQIRQAIGAQIVLEVTYDTTTRLVEPHIFGADKAGNDLLRAWQQSPLPAEWRIFRIDKISSIALTRTRFAGARMGYERDDKQIVNVYCKL